MVVDVIDDGGLAQNLEVKALVRPPDRSGHSVACSVMVPDGAEVLLQVVGLTEMREGRRDGATACTPVVLLSGARDLDGSQCASRRGERTARNR
jgi:hypothetical protein